MAMFLGPWSMKMLMGGVWLIGVPVSNTGAIGAFSEYVGRATGVRWEIIALENDESARIRGVNASSHPQGCHLFPLCIQSQARCVCAKQCCQIVEHRLQPDYSADVAVAVGPSSPPGCLTKRNPERIRVTGTEVQIAGQRCAIPFLDNAGCVSKKQTHPNACIQCGGACGRDEIRCRC